MTKAVFYIVLILSLACCLGPVGDYDLKVPVSVDVKYNDPRLQPLLSAIKAVNRDSMGFAPLDSNAHIMYKEEFGGSLVKLFFERPGFLTILYFDKSDKGIFYEREEEMTKGPGKMFVKDIDGYKTEIQETVTRIYDKNKNNLAGKNLLIRFLDINKYPDKRPYSEEHSVAYSQVEYETEITIQQASEVIARWRPSKL